MSCHSSNHSMPVAQPTASELILRQDNLAIYQLTCPEFDALTPRLQRYAYHLCKAAIAGRDIYFDQTAPRSLEIKACIEELLWPKDIDPELRKKVERYAVKFLTFNGNYDPETSRKFVPEFTYEEMNHQFRRIWKLVMTGDGHQIEVDNAWLDLKPYIFDPDFRPVLVNKSPESGDPISASAINLYDKGITRRQIEAAPSHYGLNGRFALADNQLVEEVYRAGAPHIAPGRMAKAMEAIIAELELALADAPDGSRPALQALIEYFRTGEPEAFDRHCRLWVKDNNSPVDYILGFIEVYNDPLGKRGSFEGGVFVEDTPATAALRSLAENAAWFEARMPWEDDFKKKDFTPPSAKAVKMLIGVGGEGPTCPGGINLPNDSRLRETVGTKNFILTNVMESGADERAKLLFGEFIYSPEERTLALQGFNERRMAMTALHEIVGHGSGRISPDLKGDPDSYLKEFASTLEEARADLVALWFVGDPKLVELGVLSPAVTRKSAYTAELAYTLIDLRYMPKGDQFEEDHARAEHLIASYLISKGGAKIEIIEGKAYCRLVEVEVTHRAVGDLLAQIQRIKATGDYAAGKKLVETYGIKFDPKLRDEVIARAKPLDIPDRIAFAMPEIVPVRNKMGGVESFKITYPKDFIGQMIRFGGKSN